ncbi:lysophospholipid acyltransferase family protein [Glaciecola sp. KUL10]|uniref:lysophospholipid acyltransferase family protein n=1 Tax=Glaciecola sp. (strain KUL10) TaxID=2161813 RepID=UPI000D7859F0|nr:lysophospholipid acyltransferase family protein [Glaciecola sp. KUL10]GBL03787.1 acyltransferase family protein [Glaciecola sp. KUL10]
MNTDEYAHLNGKPPKGGNRVAASFGGFLLRLFKWKIQGQLPHYKKMVIAVAPHTSNWDFFLGVAVLFVLRIRIKFLGKHSIFIPVFKQVLTRLGGIPVDRRATHGVVEQITRAFNSHEAMILAVAPEGTRSPVYPWKTGFLAVAQEARVPVLLIGFDFKLKTVIIGEIIYPSGDLNNDMQKVYDFFKSINAKYPSKVIT